MRTKLASTLVAVMFRKGALVKNPLCALIAACVMAPVAVAGSAQSGPLTLTPAEMDAVTAGAFDANVNVNATANGLFLAFTQTNGSSAVVVSNGSSSPMLNAYSAWAGGEAIAVGVGGSGAATSTTIVPVTNVPTSNTHTWSLNIDAKGRFSEISAGLTITTGTFVIPFLVH